MSFKASRNKATKCGSNSLARQGKGEMGGGSSAGSERDSSAIVQSADNGRATLWDSVLVSLSISVLCDALCVCVCVL